MANPTAATTPEERAELPGAPSNPDRALTVAAIVLPAVAVFAAAATWSRTVGWGELVAALAVFLVANFGINAGFHRLFSHHGYVPNRSLKLSLAGAGCLALQGSPTAWVATHRLHHAHSDHAGDPHSPHAHCDPDRTLRGGTIRRLLHAHAGWLFDTATPDADRWAPDMVADPDQRTIDRWYPLFVPVSLIVPFFVGWAIGGSTSAGIWAFVWVSGVRVFVGFHTTWGVNSLCHMFGRRPFDAGDRSTNLAAMSVISMGESWHNNHHAFPNLARHGIGPGEIDPTARIIQLFERLGWATKVRWPSDQVRDAARDARRRPAEQR